MSLKLVSLFFGGIALLLIFDITKYGFIENVLWTWWDLIKIDDPDWDEDAFWKEYRRKWTFQDCGWFLVSSIDSLFKDPL